MQDLNLGCMIETVHVDFDGCAVAFDVPAGQCVDMLKSVRFCVDAMPDVRFIGTFAGGKPDTAYYKMRGESHEDAVNIDGAHWLALEPGQWH